MTLIFLLQKDTLTSKPIDLCELHLKQQLIVDLSHQPENKRTINPTQRHITAHDHQSMMYLDSGV